MIRKPKHYTQVLERYWEFGQIIDLRRRVRTAEDTELARRFQKEIGDHYRTLAKNGYSEKVVRRCVDFHERHGGL